MPTCPVCGYPELQEPPRAPAGGGSYEICPSCGFQFGVDDDDKGLTFEEARERWIAGGMKWTSSGRTEPKGWDAKSQVEALARQSKGAGVRAVPPVS
jgi:hypothetical protein